MSTKLSESELAEIGQRRAAVNEAKWTASQTPNDGRWAVLGPYFELPLFSKVPLTTKERAEFIAHSLTDIPALLGHITALESELKAAQEDTNKAWEMFDRCFEIEPRAYFEKEARVNGFESPLAQAVFHLWKRETKQTVDVVAALAPVAVNNFRTRLVEAVRDAEWWLSLEERESAIQLIQTFELEK